MTCCGNVPWMKTSHTPIVLIFSFLICEQFFLTVFVIVNSCELGSQLKRDYQCVHTTLVKTVLLLGPTMMTFW